MRLKSAILAVLVLLLCGTTPALAKKTKTGEVDKNLYTDARYGFTIEKNDNWKFQIHKEKPDKPALFRFNMAKAIYQLPTRRQFSRGTWNVAFGGFFVDTTSLTIEQFKNLLVQETKENKKNKQRKEILNVAEIMYLGKFGTERRFIFPKLPRGYRLTYKQDLDIEITDARGGLSVLSEHLMGETYFTIDAGLVYLFFFFSERVEYRICKQDIERMLATLTFPEKEKAAKQAEDQKVQEEAAPADSGK